MGLPAQIWVTCVAEMTLLVAFVLLLAPATTSLLATPPTLTARVAVARRCSLRMMPREQGDRIWLIDGNNLMGHRKVRTLQALCKHSASARLHTMNCDDMCFRFVLSLR